MVECRERLEWRGEFEGREYFELKQVEAEWLGRAEIEDGEYKRSGYVVLS